MKRKMYAVGLVLALAIGLIGCTLFDSDRESPTAPMGSAELVGNCYASNSSSSSLGIYAGTGFFVLNVPAATYELGYTTNWGTFWVVFTASKNSMLYIGLNSGDVLKSVKLRQGSIKKGAILSSGPIAFYEIPNKAGSSSEADFTPAGTGDFSGVFENGVVKAGVWAIPASVAGPFAAPVAGTTAATK